MSAETILQLVAGLVLLAGGAELLVRGATGLAIAAGISPLVVGLTVVAFGTSSPEIAVSVHSALTGQADLAVGNVVGSNILNILVILGLGALIRPLIVHRALVRFDVPLMIGASALVYLLGLDGRFSRPEGVALFLILAAYLTWSVRKSLSETRKEQAGTDDVQAGTARRRGLPLRIVQSVSGLGILVLGSRLLVDSSVTLARAFGVSELIIGLTIVAAGTSLPEVATSLIAAFKREEDIAVGNAVGSNMFNILGVLGLAAALAPDGVAVSVPALSFDIPVMVGVAVACLPVFFTEHRISRWEGGVFLLFYGAYLAYLVLGALHHDALAPFSATMFYFVLPLTAVTLLVLGVRALRQRHGAASGT